MIYKSIVHKFVQWLAVAMLLGFCFGGSVMAQSDPTLNQIYATAQAGKLDEAQGMINKVLVDHPKSGKAHFVQAELFARQGKLDLSQDSLDSAEKLSPGFPFAKSEAIQALRSQIANKARSKSFGSAAAQFASPVTLVKPALPSWGLPLLLTGSAIVGGYLFFRRKAPSMAQQASYANPSDMNGSQSFGTSAGCRR